MSPQIDLHSIDSMIDKAVEAETAHLNNALPEADRKRGKRIANLCFRRALRLEGGDPGQYDVLS